MRRMPIIVASVLAGLGLCGCAEPSAAPPTGEAWSRERLERESYAQVFDAARYAAGQWFPIADARPDTGLITTQSVETDERGGTGRLRDQAVNYRNRVRRFATIRIEPPPARGQPPAEVIVAECQVRKQRLDTPDLRAFANQRSSSEAPVDTPIQREAGASAEQSQAWTDVGRDRAMERRILDVVRSRVRAQPAPATAPAK